MTLTPVEASEEIGRKIKAEQQAKTSVVLLKGKLNPDQFPALVETTKSELLKSGRYSF